MLSKSGRELQNYLREGESLKVFEQKNNMLKMVLKEEFLAGARDQRKKPQSKPLQQFTHGPASFHKVTAAGVERNKQTAVFGKLQIIRGEDEE